jgi:hypothetical protein
MGLYEKKGNRWVKSGSKPVVGAKGEDGGYYKPEKGADGLLRWIASKVGMPPVDPVSINGKDGADGKSAYEIAVARGYKGTESEWLTSLNGADGTNGKDGADGKNGIDGKDGKNGIDGKDGANGVDGKDGKDGVDGKNGTDGKDGYTPVRGTDYWTEADIAEIKDYVDEAILGGAW